MEPPGTFCARMIVISGEIVYNDDTFGGVFIKFGPGTCGILPVGPVNPRRILAVGAPLLALSLGVRRGFERDGAAHSLRLSRGQGQCSCRAVAWSFAKHSTRSREAKVDSAASLFIARKLSKDNTPRVLS